MSEEEVISALLREAEKALAEGRRVALLLDYDGTLVPLAPLPSLARPTRDLLSLLTRLAARPWLRLVVVSGRRTADLRRLLPVAELWLAGEHGSELWGPPGFNPPDLSGQVLPEDAREEREALEAAALVLAQLAGLAHPPPVGEDRPTEGGFLLERKKGAVALHYRIADPARAQRVLAELEARRPRWEEQGLEVLYGKKVVEVRRRGWHKGRAVQVLKSLWPEAVFFYLGDDRTDEDAFAALAEEGGVTVLVGEGGRKGSSRARYHLPSPAAVHRFLERLLHLVEPGQGVGGQ